jgi:hypothetical protein
LAGRSRSPYRLQNVISGGDRRRRLARIRACFYVPYMAYYTAKMAFCPPKISTCFLDPGAGVWWHDYALGLAQRAK